MRTLIAYVDDEMDQRLDAEVKIMKSEFPCLRVSRAGVVREALAFWLASRVTARNASDAVPPAVRNRARPAAAAL